MADKIIQCCRFGEKRGDELKVHPLLFSYDDLDQPNIDKDIKTITNIPLLLKLNSEKIVRAT